MKNSNEYHAIIDRVRRDGTFRRSLTRKSLFWFFVIFFQAYVMYPLAGFQKEMIGLAENKRNPLVIIMAFRGSGKSTIMNLAFSLWSILGAPQSKFILIISKTRKQSRFHFENIRAEIETNDLLRRDLGPLAIDQDTEGPHWIDLRKFNARIMFVGANQSVRGLRFKERRPDLIICDDIEDVSSAKSERGRQQLFDWFKSEVAPLGDTRGTRIIVLGNLIHKESLLMRLKEKIDAGVLRGVFRAYPLLDDNRRALWPEKYKMQEDIQRLQKTIPDDATWDREYLLRIASRIIVRVVDFRSHSECQECNAQKDELPKSRNGTNVFVVSTPVIEDEMVVVHAHYSCPDVLMDEERPVKELGGM